MRRGSLEYKLVATVISAGAAAAAILSVAILTHDVGLERTRLLDRMDVQATVVGESCTAALAFGDARDASDALRALRSSTEVVAAAVYARDGGLLSAYVPDPKGDARLPATAPPARRSIGDDGAVVAKAIVWKGEPLGTVFVRARTDELHARFRDYVVFLAALFCFLGFVLGTLLVSRLRRMLTRPIRDLARVAGEVRASGDFSRRAAAGGEDELGVLADGFNRMLAAIQERDEELARQRATLEETVALRTAELAATTEQLAHAQKMEAVGRLAGGIAHDFNNLLAVVLVDAHALESELPEGPQRECAAEIAEAGERGAALTRQLLAFSRKQILNPSRLDPARTIDDLSRMLARIIGERIHLVTDVPPGVRAVYMDPAQLEQALMNLAVNARDAMADGGTLRIEVRDADVGEARRGGPRPGSYVRVTVSDTGCGMPPEILAKVFEPFFTTKPRGKGTGLGLAMVYGAVQQSGGHVEVESTPGKGTRFTLHLPALPDAPAGAGPVVVPEAAANAAGGDGETVLLVEDDAQVRRAVRRMLDGAGYRVVEAASADEALAELEVHGADVVLTDIVMPGRDGLALGRALAARGARAQVLYMSGYSDEIVSAQATLDPARLIAKPFAREELLQRLRLVLDERPREASRRSA